MAPPGGDPDPGVTASFLAAVAACSWSNNHLVDPLAGVARYLSVIASRSFPGGAWAVVATAVDGLSQATYNLLKTATANADGSFTAASGAAYWLRLQAGAAVAVAK